MRKPILMALICFFTSVELISQQLNAVGIASQSAAFVRMPCRIATAEIDAVYYNPANLTFMDDGWDFSFSNQMAFVTNKLTQDYMLLVPNPKESEAKAKAGFLPSFYAQYKKRKSSFHVGFFPYGGGGGATASNSITYDRNISDAAASIPLTGFFVSPSLAELDKELLEQTGKNPGYSNFVDYRYNFEGSGFVASPAIQVGYARQFFDKLSIGFAARYVYSSLSTKFTGTDVEILPNTSSPELNNWASPGDYFRTIAELEMPNASYAAGYRALGIVLDNSIIDNLIDVKQTGAGFVWVPSISFKPNDNLLVALKYESQAKIEMKTEVFDEKNGNGVYTDGEIVASDIPAILSGGIGYQVNDKLKVNTGFRSLFYKSADFNGRDTTVLKNPIEIEIAASYTISDKLEVSGGYTRNSGNNDVDKAYQNELQFLLSGNNIAAGFRYSPAKRWSIDVGAIYSLMSSVEHTYDDHVYAMGEELVEVPENYNNQYTVKYETPLRTSIAIGINYSIRKDAEEME